MEAHQGSALRRGLGITGNICFFGAKPYGPGLKTRLRKTKTTYFFRCFLAPFSTQKLDMVSMVAWMCYHRNRGIQFNSTGNHIPAAYIDASNKQDPKSGLCQYEFDICMAGGSLVSQSSLLNNAGFGAPSQEAMGLGEFVGHMSLSLLWTSASGESVMCTWLR